jgi:superfamily II DNA or RNA helicase
MIYTFYEKEADKAYIANRLWLPKSGVRSQAVKQNLQFSASAQKGQIQLHLWSESRHHLICPREFIPTRMYPEFNFPFVDVRPSFREVDFEDLVKPWNEDQVRAWEALRYNDNGIFNLACGKGKTKLGVKKIAHKRVPAIIVVPDAGILDQWRRSIHGDERTPPGLRFKGDLGIIAGDTFDWAHPVTLALITTLAARIKDGRIPEEFWRFFGLWLYDECHQTGAPDFNLTIRDAYGDKIGLTATVEREDGLTPVYLYHLGMPFYTDLVQELIPEIIFQQTPVRIPHEEALINGRTNVGVLRTVLGKNRAGNVFRYWEIRKAMDEGRKILCISHSTAQLYLFHKLFPDSGLITGETDRELRTDILRNHQVCFAISRLGSQGVDDQALDTVFYLTPFRSKIALQQSMGRIQRVYPGKKEPRYIVFEDWLCTSLKKLCQQLRARLTEWGYKYTARKPGTLPLDFPSEICDAYDAEFQRVQGLRDESDGED